MHNSTTEEIRKQVEKGKGFRQSIKAQLDAERVMLTRLINSIDAPKAKR
jgi:hypothetical protein